MSKLVECWAVKHWREGIYADTVRRTRRESIAAFMEEYDVTLETWDRDVRNLVHRCIKVAVLPQVGLTGLRS